MGNPELPGVTALPFSLFTPSYCLSLLLLPPFPCFSSRLFLHFHSILLPSLHLAFFIYFIPLVLFSCRSFVTRAPASPSFFSLSPLSFLRQSLLPFLCARNVDLNDIFGGKFRGNRGKHSTLSGFFLRVPPTPSLFVQHRLSVLLRKQARPENIVNTYFARTSRPRGVVLATEPGGLCWLTLLHVY